MKPTQKTKRAVLVSAPGMVRNATCAVLGSFPDVLLIGVASGALSATRLLQQDQPDVMLIDANLADEEVLTLLRWTAEHYAAVPCLVMTMASRQRDQAVDWGAAATVQRANLAEELEVVLDDLVPTGSRDSLEGA